MFNTDFHASKTYRELRLREAEQERLARLARSNRRGKLALAKLWKR